MLTRMTERDWEVVLDVFRAARSRRGDKGRDDRRFLEALHHFTVHNITWRALPAEFGHWNSVWKRFWRFSRSGVFEAFFQALAGLSPTAHLVQMFDSTRCAPTSRRPGQRGAAGSGARPLPWRVLDQDPPEDGLRGPAAGLPPHRRGGQRQPPVRDPARPRARR